MEVDREAGREAGSRKGVMMKRILMTITAVGTLAVPAGLALAQIDDTTVDTGASTTVVYEQDQLRLRDQDQLRLHDGDCELCDGVHARIREQVRSTEATGEMVRRQLRVEGDENDTGEQVRLQLEAHEGAGEQVRNQLRVEDCDDCTGEQVRSQLEAHEGAGEQVRAGPNGR